MIESPIVSDSITNKQATQKASIYHTCRSVLNALGYVPGFQVFIDTEDVEASDPLTKLWHICKQGASLCYLYNTLQPETPIQVNTNSSAANKSKACVYHFIVACRDQLHFAEDTLFTISDLYQNDTNKFVKVL
jgi:cell division control protein 24